MLRSAVLFAGLVASSDALRLPASSSATTSVPTSRRGLLAGAAAFAVLAPLAPAMANTEPILDKPMEKFEADAAKRAAFMEKQKMFKKAWRKALSDLEFASTDAEATEAMDTLYGLIKKNGFEIPEGVRKMDLDQVYKTVQPRLNKSSRMEFQKLDQIVRDITSVKTLSVGEQVQ
mmetsp:Transcript_49265/g.128538  ORF Transcript_49265/g.128538 Transcript_49265/m.128538 type:complete len:175 (+) Transcript_49265:1-525(+)